MASIARDSTTFPPLDTAAAHRPKERAGAAGMTWLAVGFVAAATVGWLGPGGTNAVSLFVLLGSLALADLHVLATRLGFTARTEARPSGDGALDLPAGLLALVTFATVLRFAGGTAAAALQPALYALVAYLAASNRKRVATPLVAAAIAMELGAFFTTAPNAALNSAEVFLRVGYIATFATLSAAFHRGLLLRSRSAIQRRARESKKRDEARARELRLIATDGAASLSGEHEIVDADSHSSLLADAIAACEGNAQRTLQLLRAATDADAIVLLVASGEAFQIFEAVGADDFVAHLPGSVARGTGVLGGIARARRPMRLEHVRRGLPYHGRAARPVASFVGVPLLDGARLSGILCLERHDDALGDRAEPLAEAAAEQLVRTLENERLFIHMQQARAELQQLFQASRALSGDLDIDAVVALGLDSAARLVDFDAAAVTLFDAATNAHRVVGVRGARLASLQGQRFQANQGLVSMAVKMHHYLPARGRGARNGYVFLPETKALRGYPSLLVMPLMARDQPIGTFVVASSEPGAFAAQRRDMLGLFTNQLAVALANASMYARMEQLATTDGLTSLLNRRTFLEHYATGLARAERSGNPATVILSDIDFFKKVNDNYGHPIGDEVLRQVAALFQDTLRCVDVVGRYGGEEFVILLEDTDVEGGEQMAERLRKAVEDLTIETPKGPLKITVSLGLATWGVDGREPELLVEHADQALYACKEGGRNCLRSFSAMART